MRRWERKIPAEEQNGTEEAGGGELNILRWIKLKLSKTTLIGEEFDKRQTFKILCICSLALCREEERQREEGEKEGVEHESASQADITGVKTCPDEINVL